MTMESNGNSRVFSLLKKLLNVKEARGSSEAEATKAAETIQKILQDHNLSLAELEAQMGTADQATDAKREDNRTGIRAMYKYQRALMEAIASSNFCMHRIREVTVPRRNKNDHGPDRRSHQHQLVGRTINVQASIMLYDYLAEAMKRAAKNAGFAVDTREGHFFMEGAASRLSIRLEERRRERERESAAAKAAAATAGNGTGKELVLADVYGSETDLNNDFLNGFPAGTTATRRREQEAVYAARNAERNRLVAEGVDVTVAWYRAYGYSEEAALKVAAENATYVNRSRRRGGRGYSQRWTQSNQREYQKVNSTAYRAGTEAGGKISLDSQVGAASNKKLPKSKT